jgi:hypothetical protein
VASVVRVHGQVFWDEGSVIWIQSTGLRVEGERFRYKRWGSRVWGSGFTPSSPVHSRENERGEGLGLRVWGLRSAVCGVGCEGLASRA